MTGKREASRFAAFLLSLQTSPQAWKRFQKDPEGEMKRFDLSPGTIHAVTSKDTVTLWKTLIIHQVAAVVRGERGRHGRKAKRT